MLKQLSIRNYALIESLDISFDAGLNILTGETGSGKSIILGAIGLIIGERAEIRVVQDGKKKCIVEGHFDLERTGLEPAFEKYDLDFETTTIIRREILATGKSRAFINDTPVNLGALKEIGTKLVDIHSQHQTAQINDPRFQLNLVDRYAGSHDELRVFSDHYAAYKKSGRLLAEAREKQRNTLSEDEFLNFQLDELDRASLDAIDAETLDDEYNELAHAEEISQTLFDALHALRDAEPAAIQMLRTARDKVAVLRDFSKTYDEFHERLNSVLIELDDLAGEVESIQNNIEADPARLAKLEEVKSILFRLEKKHGVEGVVALRQKRDQIRERLEESQSQDGFIAELEAKVIATLEKTTQSGGKLHKIRKASLPQLTKEVIKVLKSLNMPSAQFTIDLLPTDMPTAQGLERAEIRFSANAGHKPESLKLVASGGELSRLMLSIKKLAAAETNQTIIFDEIDTGVSGEVANAMGGIMKDMAADMQLICITHLPQIASKGRSHFKVYKVIDQGKTETRIDHLDEKGRVAEIAQMLSGATTTDAALANARDLLLAN